MTQECKCDAEQTVAPEEVLAFWRAAGPDKWFKKDPAFAAQIIINTIASHAAEPGPQLARFAQVTQVLPCRDKRFLGQILALPQTAGGAVSQRTNQRLVTRDDLSESIPISSEARRDEPGIVGISGEYRLVVYQLIA